MIVPFHKTNGLRSVIICNKNLTHDKRETLFNQNVHNCIKTYINLCAYNEHRNILQKLFTYYELHCNKRHILKLLISFKY